MKLLQTNLSIKAIAAKAAPTVGANSFANMFGAALAVIALDYGNK
jgi:hypothetical protein